MRFGICHVVFIFKPKHLFCCLTDGFISLLDGRPAWIRLAPKDIPTFLLDRDVGWVPICFL